MLGKSLCGSSFSVRFEDFGLSFKSAPSKKKDESKRDENQAKSDQLPSPSDASNCSRLYQQMRSIGGPVIGNLLTPLLFGKILYTPHTNATHKLIQKVYLF